MASKTKAKKGRAAPPRQRSKPAPAKKAGAEPPASRSEVNEQSVEVMPFFEGQRLKVQLRNWAPRNSPAKEFRLHLDLSIPLSGVVSMPHQIAAAFQSVATLDNGIPKCDVEALVDPQTITIYATPESPRPALSWPASILNKLIVVRPKVESKKDVTEIELRLTTTVKVTDDQLIWTKNHTGKFFWSEFAVTQGAMLTEARKARSNGKTEGENKQTSFEISDFAGSEQQKAVNEIQIPASGKDAAAGADR